MTPPLSPEEEFRQQRHEFILRYYDMATKDLDRHLKIGWQSIAILGAAVASLSLGEGGTLPLPFAVAGAIIVCFWGMGNILDANYWSVRAIGFLANVEAIYLSEEDRSAFNPYLGKHPPIKLMDSLRHQFRAITIFLFVSFAYYLYKIVEKDGLAAGLEKFTGYGLIEFFMWELPVVLAAFLLVLVLRNWRKRVQDYRSFVTGSPGPGIVRERSVHRGVDLATLDSHLLIAPDTAQKSTVGQIDTALGKLNRDVILSEILAVVIVFGVVFLAVAYSSGW